MALTERLALLVSLDADGAVRGLNKVGKAADTNLSRAESKLDRLGAGMQKAGIGLASLGGLAVVGLYKTAQASEEANLAVVKLENSLANNPKLAGESSAAFLDLADAIQDKTAADGDAIVAGQAMLGTFRVTGDQIRELTPLVVDYARKFGTDLVTANASVGKALDGNVGALKRNGVSIDEVLFKTDRYAAVQKALAEQVGGFAEAEGATFAGSVERMKNQLGDLTESVGGGAVEAFSSMFAGIGAVTERVEQLDPALVKGAGKFATFGSVAFIAAGGLAYVVGKTIEMRDTLAPLGGRLRKAEGGLTGLGKAGVAAGGALAAIGLIQVAREAAELTVDMDELTRALDDNSEAGRRNLDREVQALSAMGELDEAVKAAAESNVIAAERLIDVAEAAGLSADKISELRTIVDEKRQADVLATRDAQDYASQVQAAVGPTGELADGTDDLTGGLSGVGDEATTTADKIKELEEAYQGLLDATLSQFDADLKYRGSLDATEDSLIAVNDAIKEHGTNSEEYRRAILDAEGALLDQAAAAADLIIQTAEVGGEQLSAAEKTAIHKSSLEGVRDTLAPGSPLRGALDGYVAKLREVPATLKTKMLVDAGGAFRTVQEFLAYINAAGFTTALNATANLGFKNDQNLSGSRASGGPMEAFGTYQVHKDELITMGATPARVTPAHASGGGGSQTIVVQVGDRVIDELVVDSLGRVESRNGAVRVRTRTS